VERLEALGRKRSHLEAVRSHLREHIGPFFDGCTLESVERRDVEAFMAAKRREGKAPKSVLNYVGTLHSIFAFGQDRGWCRSNPAKLAEKPKPPEAAEIRFLDEPELEALLRAVPDDVLGAVEGPLYLAAAMTGARQGELLGLRWGDVDWTASKVRIRRAWVRGEMGTPKSRRGSRAVPLAQRLAVELERHYQASRYQSDSDLVFGHPLLGVPLDRSKVLKRFKATLRAGGVRAVRFHDLRHTFGTRMAAAGVPMRTLQEWMGHRDFKTTLIYADYMPGQHEAELVDAAFGQGSIEGSKLSEPEARSHT
jgi:integrase